MKNKIFACILWVMTFALMACVFLMPEIVPTHWGISGKVDAYGSRYFMLALDLLGLATYYGMGLTRKIDPEKESIEKQIDTYELFRMLLGTLMLGLCGYITLMIFYPTLNIQMGLCLLLGLFFIAMGNYSPRIPKNYFLGIRTPWTLKNEKVWTKSHRFGGIVDVITGLCIIVCAFLPPVLSIILLLVSVLAGTGVIVAYSYLIYNKITRESHEQ